MEAPPGKPPAAAASESLQECVSGYGYAVQFMEATSPRTGRCGH